jgi:hypothetical protein
MANNVTVVNQLVVNLTSPKDYQSFNESVSFAPSSPLIHPDEQSVPTTAAGTAVPYGAVSGATPGEIIFKNVDLVNYIEVGQQVSGTFYPFARMDPGRCCGPFNVANSVQLYWRANTLAAVCKMLLTAR